LQQTFIQLRCRFNIWHIFVSCSGAYPYLILNWIFMRFHILHFMHEEHG
jgi:hypothetical protein